MGVDVLGWSGHDVLLLHVGGFVAGRCGSNDREGGKSAHDDDGEMHIDWLVGKMKPEDLLSLVVVIAGDGGDWMCFNWCRQAVVMMERRLFEAGKYGYLLQLNFDTRSTILAQMSIYVRMVFIVSKFSACV